MSYHIGRKKSGELVRMYKTSTAGMGIDGEYVVEVDGSIASNHKSREKAIKEAKKKMLESYLTATDKELNDFLNSNIDISYDFQNERS